MPKLSFSGIDEYFGKLNALEKSTQGLIKRAVFDGAAVAVEAVRAQIKALPEVEDHYVAEANRPIRGITATQKRGLLDGLGLSKMQNSNGFINTKTGFSGYNSTKTRKYPNGQPNALIAGAVNSGSSVRTKIPFVSKAAKAAKPGAEAAMQKRFDEDTKKLMN